MGVVAVLAVGCLGLFSSGALAQVDTTVTTDFANQTGLGAQTDVRLVIIRAIQFLLGFLGLVAVIIVLYGGYLYLTSGGNAERSELGRRVLINGFIGLVVILFAVAIVGFVLRWFGPNGVVGESCTPPATEVRSCPDGNASQSRTCAADGTWDNWTPTCPTTTQPFGVTSIVPVDGSTDEVRNTRVIVRFNKALDPTTITASSFTVTDTTAGTAVDGSRTVSGQTVTFVPTALCPNSSPRHCFDVSDFSVQLQAATIKTTNAEPLTCAGPNCTSEFTTIDQIDETGPRLSLLQPTGNQVPIGVVQPVTAEAVEPAAETGVDSLTILINRQDGTTEATYGPFSPLPANIDDFIKTQNWTVNLTAGERRVIKVDAVDVAENASTISRTVTAVPAHCVNNRRDAGESGVDCGTDVGCLACAGAACRLPSEAASVCSANSCASGACSGNVAATCVCVGRPVINSVTPLDGKPGNFVTLTGTGFGATATGAKVLFLGSSGPGVEAIIPAICGAGAWSDTQVIIEIPAGAGNGPLQLITSANTSDRTDDGSGVNASFTINDIARPGLCGVSLVDASAKACAGTDVRFAGTQFGATYTPANDAALFGDIAMTPNAGGWTNPQVLGKIPNITPGTVRAQIKKGPRYSNPVNFAVQSCVPPPRIIEVDPPAGPVGQYVTVTGTNFGRNQGTVEFSDGAAWHEAETSFPAQCTVTWEDGQILVKVPTGMIAGVPQPIRVIRADGEVSCSSVTSCDDDQFRVNTAAITPGLCKISPVSGPEGTPVDLFGENFGPQKDVKFSVDKLQSTFASPASWAAQEIKGAKVPPGATSGPVSVVHQNGQNSNGLNFSVKTCQNDTQCSTDYKCCAGAGSCVLTGTNCPVAPALPISSYPWRFTTGTLPPPLPPRPIIESIEPVDATNVPNGAPGNYLVIHGQNFGTNADSTGRINFLGDETNPAIVGLAPDALSCPAGSFWSSTKIIIEVPNVRGASAADLTDDAQDGPMEVITATQDGAQTDRTDDDNGPSIKDFDANTTVRPGVACVVPSKQCVNGNVAVYGKFGTKEDDDRVVFGNSDSLVKTWAATRIDVDVPNIRPSTVGLRVEDNGQKSNAFDFTVTGSCPAIPRIDDISPNNGPTGQYVTITGANFGGAQGKVIFVKGADEFIADISFPAQCAPRQWRDTQIIVKAPDFGSVALESELIVYVEAVNGQRSEPTASVAKDDTFVFNNAPLAPGLCLLNPSKGPISTPITLIGDNFGAAADGKVVRFFNGQSVDWANNNDSSVWQDADWSKQQIKGARVPENAESGPVVVADTTRKACSKNLRKDCSAVACEVDLTATPPVDEGTCQDVQSNPIDFSVGACNSDDQCGFGSQCCADGACRVSGTCAPINRKTAYRWEFTTAKRVAAPRVVEQQQCRDANILQNGNFEDTTDSSLLGWSLPQDLGKLQTDSVTPPPQALGQHFAVLSPAPPGCEADFFGCAVFPILSDEIELGRPLADNTFTLSFWARSTGDKANNVQADLFDSIGSSLLGSFAFTTPALTSEWKQYNSTITLPSDVMSTQLQLGLTMTTTQDTDPVWFDGVQLIDPQANPIQSPTPWKGSQDACMNARISVRFTTALEPTVCNDFDALKIYSCGGDATCSSPTGPLNLANASCFGVSGVPPTTGLLRDLDQPLEADTWYKVTVDNTKITTVAPELKAMVKPYEWLFKTSNKPCAVASVSCQAAPSILQQQSAISQLSAHQQAANCNILACGPTDISWRTVSPAGRDGVTLGHQSPSVVPDWSCVNSAVAVSEGNGPAQIEAVAAEGTPGQCRIDVAFSALTVIDYQPSCHSACTNSAVQATFSTEIDDTTLPGAVHMLECASLTGTCSTFNLTSALTMDNDDDPTTPEVLQINPAQPLLTDRFYRVVLDNSIESREGKALSGLNFDFTPDANNTLDSFKWDFKTSSKAGTNGVCAVDRLDLVPPRATLYTIGAKQSYFAQPWSNNLECSPKGQPLNPFASGYKWTSLISVNPPPPVSGEDVATISSSDLLLDIDGNGVGDDARIDPLQIATAVGVDDSCQEKTNIISRQGVQCKTNIHAATTSAAGLPATDDIGTCDVPTGKCSNKSEPTGCTGPANCVIVRGNIEATPSPLTLVCGNTPNGRCVDNTQTATTGDAICTNGLSCVTPGVNAPCNPPSLATQCGGPTRNPNGTCDKSAADPAAWFCTNDNRVSCGADRDCTFAVTRSGCCGARPWVEGVVGTRSVIDAPKYCPNAALTVTFNEEMNSESILNNTFLERKVKVRDTNADLKTDCADTQTVASASDLPWWRRTWNRIVAFFTRSADAADEVTIWCPVEVKKTVVAEEIVGSNPPRFKSALRITAVGLLSHTADYRVHVLGESEVEPTGRAANAIGIQMQETDPTRTDGNDENGVPQNGYAFYLGKTAPAGERISDRVCPIDRVEVIVEPSLSVDQALRSPSTPTRPYDIFNCEGNDCNCVESTGKLACRLTAQPDTYAPEDQDAGTAGNQHTYTAQALDSKGNPLGADFRWGDGICQAGSERGKLCSADSECPGGGAGSCRQELDPQSVIELESIKCVGGANDGNSCGVAADCPDGQCKGPTRDPKLVLKDNNKNGLGNVRVIASVAGIAESKTVNVPVVVDLCAYPWTSPLQDGPGNGSVCQGGTNHGGDCTANSNLCTGNGKCVLVTNFRTTYCRGNTAGASLLPDFSAPVMVSGQRSTGVLREWLIPEVAQPGVTSSIDAIGIQVRENPRHLSAQDWYATQPFRQGSPQSIEIDGYAAVREGRTVYVAAGNAVTVGSARQLYTNIYVFSHTQGAKATTARVFNELIKNAQFNINHVSTGSCFAKGSGSGTVGNLLTNPSFELVSGSSAVNWAGSNAVNDATSGYGAKVLQFLGTAQLLPPGVEVAGQKFVLTFLAKGTAGASLTASIKYNTSVTGEASAVFVSSGTSTITPDATWQQYVADIQVPADVTVTTPQIRLVGASVFIDAIQLVRKGGELSALSPQPCLIDTDCSENQYCSGGKGQIARDTRRLEDLLKLSSKLSGHFYGDQCPTSSTAVGAPGDADCNGIINADDISIAKAYAATPPLAGYVYSPSQQCKGADYNLNGSVTTADVNLIIKAVTASCGGARNIYPSLAAGSYLPGISTSTWPSWQNTLGAQGSLPGPLPTDPLNTLAACSSSTPGTCWNETTKRYICQAQPAACNLSSSSKAYPPAVPLPTDYGFANARFSHVYTYAAYGYCEDDPPYDTVCASDSDCRTGKTCIQVGTNYAACNFLEACYTPQPTILGQAVATPPGRRFCQVTQASVAAALPPDTTGACIDAESLNLPPEPPARNDVTVAIVDGNGAPVATPVPFTISLRGELGATIIVHDCAPTANPCTKNFPVGFRVTMAATSTPAMGSFAGWQPGANVPAAGCYGTANCEFTVSNVGASVVQATFTNNQPPTASISAPTSVGAAAGQPTVIDIADGLTGRLSSDPEDCPSGSANEANALNCLTFSWSATCTGGTCPVTNASSASPTITVAPVTAPLDVTVTLTVGDIETPPGNRSSDPVSKVIRILPGTFTLNVERTPAAASTAGVRVTSTPAGIDCGSTCGKAYTVGTSVTLNPSGAGCYIPTGWTGNTTSCTPTGNALACPMSEDRSVQATFGIASRTLRVTTTSTNGSATITGNGMTCTISGGTTTGCTVTIPCDATASLTETHDSADTDFISWQGCGSNPTPSQCNGISMAAGDKEIVVNIIGRAYELNVQKAGLAADAGRVTVSPNGANTAMGCLSAGSCAQATDNYTSGQTVTLSQSVSGSGAQFTGWAYSAGTVIVSGCGTTGGIPDAQCAVSMTGSVTVTANFNYQTYQMTVKKAGNGGGSVAPTANLGTPTSSTCSWAAADTQDCTVTAIRHGSNLTLTASPVGAGTTASWANCTSVSGNVCTVNNVTADRTSAPLPTVTFLNSIGLTVTMAGDATTSTMTAAGITFSPTTCLQSAGTCFNDTVSTGQPITLTATPLPSGGTQTVTWAGVTCVGGNTGNVCEFNMPSGTTAVTATINLKTYGTTITKDLASTGTGTVAVSAPASPSTCSTTSYPCPITGIKHGSSVTFTASAAAGILVSWSNCPGSVGATCTYTNVTGDITSFPIVKFTQTSTLTLTKSGPAGSSGTISAISFTGWPTYSGPASCGTVANPFPCTIPNVPAGAAVSITAAPAVGNAFTGFTCTGASCTATGSVLNPVTFTGGAITIDVAFAKTYTITMTTVHNTGNAGQVSLASLTPPQTEFTPVTCNTTCSYNAVLDGRAATLTRTPSGSQYLVGWFTDPAATIPVSGAPGFTNITGCVSNGTAAAPAGNCTFTPTSDVTVYAKFNSSPTVTLACTPTGSSLTSACTGTFAATYDTDKDLTVTATVTDPDGASDTQFTYAWDLPEHGTLTCPKTGALIATPTSSPYALTCNVRVPSPVGIQRLSGLGLTDLGTSFSQTGCLSNNCQICNTNWCRAKGSGLPAGAWMRSRTSNIKGNGLAVVVFVHLKSVPDGVVIPEVRLKNTTTGAWYTTPSITAPMVDPGNPPCKRTGPRTMAYVFVLGNVSSDTPYEIHISPINSSNAMHYEAMAYTGVASSPSHAFDSTNKWATCDGGVASRPYQVSVGAITNPRSALVVGVARQYNSTPAGGRDAAWTPLPAISNKCVGGTNNNNTCAGSVDCPGGGFCTARTVWHSPFVPLISVGDNQIDNPTNDHIFNAFDLIPAADFVTNNSVWGFDSVGEQNWSATAVELVPLPSGAYTIDPFKVQVTDSSGAASTQVSAPSSGSINILPN